jgi:hypothetical protein
MGFKYLGFSASFPVLDAGAAGGREDPEPLFHRGSDKSILFREILTSGRS